MHAAVQWRFAARYDATSTARGTSDLSFVSG